MSIKIIYAVNGRFPSERAYMVQIVQMCCALVRKDVDLTLVVNSHQSTIREEPQKYYGTSLPFPILKQWVPRFSINNKYTYFLQRIIFSAQLIFLLKKQPDHLLYCRDEWIVFLISFFLPKYKIIWESHEAKFNFAAKKIIKKGVKCVCISEGIYNEYFRRGVSCSQMIVAHDGIDDTFFEEMPSRLAARKELGLGVDEKIVMYIGGLDAWKGIETLFLASAFLKKMKLVIIGGSFEQIEHYSNLYSEITFLGARPYRDLKYHQQAADVLVVPNTAKNNLSGSYTSPLKLFAHMTAKIPIVLSDIPSLKSVVCEDCAFWFEPDNPQSLAEAIEEALMLNSSKENTMILKCYNLSKNYTWTRRAEAILNFILGNNLDNGKNSK